MDRVSDTRLETLAKLFTETAMERIDEDVASALTELRERRAAEHGVVKFKWACRCGHVNVWSWPAVEYDNWVSTHMQCDKCNQVTKLHTRPEIVKK